MEAVALVILVLIGLWVAYKLGFAKVVVDLTDSAQISAAQFTNSVTNNALREAAKDGVSEEVYKKAMINNARTREAKRSMLDDDFNYEPESKSE